LTKPRGIRSCSSDNTRLSEVLKWKPSVNLEEGLSLTYRWIEKELLNAGRISMARMSAAAD
jgi:GDP-D-mannose 3',5'-epimerase